jgi:hypothetical protein
MKKLFYTMVLFLLVAEGFGQGTTGIWPRNYLNVRIGPEIAFPIKQLSYFQNMGVGGTLLVDLPLTQRISGVASVGYMSFAGDKTPWDFTTRFERATVLPVRAGAYYRLLPDFYGGAQVGYSMVSWPAQYPEENGGGFSQSIGAFYFDGKFEVGASWDYHYIYGGLNSMNLRVAYAIFRGGRM